MEFNTYNFKEKYLIESPSTKKRFPLKSYIIYKWYECRLTDSLYNIDFFTVIGHRQYLKLLDTTVRDLLACYEKNEIYFSYLQIEHLSATRSGATASNS